jgi:hypothetical protein
LAKAEEDVAKEEEATGQLLLDANYFAFVELDVFV